MCHTCRPFPSFRTCLDRNETLRPHRGPLHGVPGVKTSSNPSQDLTATGHLHVSPGSFKQMAAECQGIKMGPSMLLSRPSPPGGNWCTCSMLSNWTSSSTLSTSGGARGQAGPQSPAKAWPGMLMNARSPLDTEQMPCSRPAQPKP